MIMKNFDFIILGAGASGCICALTASKSGKNILVIDKLTKAGKKLMATGNGRCNLSNQNIFPSVKYFNQDIDKFLKRFDNKDTLDYFANIGLISYSDSEGRVYPFSNSAKSVIDVFNNQFENNKNVTLSLENEVTKVEKYENSFIVYSAKGNFSCEKLIVATGGKSAENIFENFELNSKPFVPSLVAIKTENTRSLEGVRISNAKIKASCKGKSYTETGEILFKDSGISGIVSFNSSTLFARNNDFDGTITIDLMPDYNLENIVELLKSRRHLNVKIKNLFDGMFVSQVGYYILNKVKIENEERPVSTLSDKEIERLAYTIKNISLKVKGHYENNQVHSGGIMLADLTKNLESKKIKNLYFCGEVCDVDGICGGYNLQWAWTSGRIVGESL